MLETPQATTADTALPYNYVDHQGHLLVTTTRTSSDRDSCCQVDLIPLLLQYLALEVRLR